MSGVEAWLARAMRSPDPVATLRAASEDPAIEPEVRAALARVDPDGVRIQALLVANLRFERLLAGSAEALAAFEEDGARFARIFERYHREVPMTASFPGAEARLFAAWVATSAPPRGPA